MPRWHKPVPVQGLRAELARRSRTAAERWPSYPHFRVVADALEHGRPVILPCWLIPKDRRPAGREQTLVRMAAGTDELSWEPYEHVATEYEPDD